MQHVRASVDRVARGRPVSRALLPQWAARLIGFAALGVIGALEWQRLVGGLSDGRALVWVIAAVGASLGVLAAGRARVGWPRGVALAGAALFGVGATISLFTGRGAFRGGVRMLLIGGAAATTTFLIGRALGVK